MDKSIFKYAQLWRLLYEKNGETALEDGIAGLQYRKGIKVSTSVDTSMPMKKRLSKNEREDLLALRKRNEFLDLEREFLK